ncbi:MAG TPA: DUF4349 domain-containing protein [Candidatus Acidoferrales bacterium]
MNVPTHEVEQEEVMAYLDGELSPSRSFEVATHLEHCSGCAALALELRGISDKTSNWNVGVPSESLGKNISRAVDQRAGKQVRSSNQNTRRFLLALWSGAWLWRLATVACGIFLVFVYLYPHLLLPAPTTSPQAMMADIRHVDNATVARSTEPASNAKAKIATTLGDPRSELDTNGLVTPQRNVSDGPMIARSASMNLVVAKLEPVRDELERILKRHNGYAGEMTVDNTHGTAPSLEAELRVPTSQLDNVLSELRTLGKVESETQSGDDVQERHVDLDARLHNARETEQRLIEVLRQRTGKVSDILQVEEQISQTRGEIERMEAELATLDKRVALASIKLHAGEEYKAYQSK